MMRFMLAALPVLALAAGCGKKEAQSAQAAPENIAWGIEQLRERADNGRCPELLAHPMEEVLADDQGMVRYLYGFCYRHTGDAQKALEMFDASLAMGGPAFWVHFNRAGVYAAEGKKAEAVKDLEAALKLEPGHEPARLMLKELKASGRS